jgi:predicted porin
MVLVMVVMLVVVAAAAAAAEITLYGNGQGNRKSRR